MTIDPKPHATPESGSAGPTHSLYPSWPAPEPAISLSGTMVPMYTDGRIRPGRDDRGTGKSGSVNFGIRWKGGVRFTLTEYRSRQGSLNGLSDLY